MNKCYKYPSWTGHLRFFWEGNKVFFVTDGHPAHKTKKLKVWLEENKSRIEVFFIPPYSPELNAQEYLNQDVKTNAIGKKRPTNKAPASDMLHKEISITKLNSD